MNITEFADDEVVPIQELVELYSAVGWMRYAADPDGLARAVDRSTYVVTARDGEGTLIGLARCLTDDVSIMYLQDILVHPDRQRSGIGSLLVQRCLDRYEHVRRKVLLTDDPSQLAFYELLGYRNVNNLGSLNLNAVIQFDGLDELN